VPLPTPDLPAAGLSAALDRWAAAPRAQDLSGAASAVLLLAASGELDPAGRAAQKWGDALRSFQEPGSEHLTEPAPGALAHDPDTPRGETRQVRSAPPLVTALALQALDALGLQPRHWPEGLLRAAPAEWLGALDWSQPLQAGAVTALRLQWLALFAENHANRKSGAGMDSPPSDARRTLRAALAWLDQTQDPASGLWGLRLGASYDDALLAAPAVLVFFDYLRWPARHARQRLDLALERLAHDPLPDALTAPLAIAGLAWLLAASYHHYNYRRPETAAALARLAAARPASPLPSAPAEAEPAWWAHLTRALASTAQPAPHDRPAFFLNHPGPGCLPLPALTPHERRALPRWMITLPSVELAATRSPASAARQQPPAITVVVPVFNLGRYLPEAIESVLAQTFQDFELIVMDDGSTDEYTCLLLDHWPWPRARLLRQANQGVAAARNNAIAAGAGRYVCCLDADDRLRPPYFEHATAVLDADPGLGLVSGHMQIFDGEETLIAPAVCRLPDLLAQNQIFQPSLFRRSAWQAAGGYYPGFGVSGIEDWDLWIRLLALGLRCAILPEVIFEYRSLPNSMASRLADPDAWATLFGELATRHAALYREQLVPVLMHNARRIEELRAWSRSREQGAAWWERQASNWQQNCERVEKLLAAQIEWTQQLQAGKDWLEEQMRARGLLPADTHD
jgi:hypothetical protein